MNLGQVGIEQVSTITLETFGEFGTDVCMQIQGQTFIFSREAFLSVAGSLAQVADRMLAPKG